MQKRQETQVQSLGQKDPLEKEMATNSSILAWKILWTEEPDGLQSRGSQRINTTEQLSTFIYHLSSVYYLSIYLPTYLFIRFSLENLDRYRRRERNRGERTGGEKKGKDSLFHQSKSREGMSSAFVFIISLKQKRNCI